MYIVCFKLQKKINDYEINNSKYDAFRDIVRKRNTAARPDMWTSDLLKTCSARESWNIHH